MNFRPVRLPHKNSRKFVLSDHTYLSQSRFLPIKNRGDLLQYLTPDCSRAHPIPGRDQTQKADLVSPNSTG